MKNRAILLVLGLLISSSFAFGQASKDTLRKDSIQTKIKVYFSPEKSWQISKEAYEKQLKAMGLSKKELNKRMQEFEKQKVVLIKNIKVQMETVEKQLQLSEVQRKMAEKQMEKVNKKLNSPEFKKKMEEVNKEVNKELNSPEFKKKMAEVQRKVAEVQRKLAEKQAQMAEEWKHSVKNLVHENIILSGKNSKNQTIKLKVIHKNTLFFNINCTISSGSVLIEVFDPKGQKEGELSLEHRKGSANKTKAMFSGSTSGSLNKIINAPETGDWEVKVKPKKSKGHIFISVGEFNKPAI